MCSDNGEHDASENPKEINKDGHGRTIGERIAEFCLYTIFGSQNRFRMEPYILKPRRSLATGEFGKWAIKKAYSPFKLAEIYLEFAQLQWLLRGLRFLCRKIRPALRKGGS